MAGLTWNISFKNNKLARFNICRQAKKEKLVFNRRKRRALLISFCRETIRADRCASKNKDSNIYRVNNLAIKILVNRASLIGFLPFEPSILPLDISVAYRRRRCSFIVDNLCPCAFASSINRDIVDTMEARIQIIQVFAWLPRRFHSLTRNVRSLYRGKVSWYFL